MRNVKVILEYDGTDFLGFQKQPARRTVQGELEIALGKLLKEPTRVIGAGRTDAGVHATGQVISFGMEGTIPIDRMVLAMNAWLPRDIRARTAEEVSDDFHARYSARSRTYIYTVLNRGEPSAILGRYTWRVTKPLDVEAMTSAAGELLGTHDFASFGMPDKTGGSTVRQVFQCRIWRSGDAVFVGIRANAFLRGMVRAIAGTLVDIGQGNRPAVDIVKILAARDRQAARVTAPPQGLCLTRVEY